jgi:hypothetical protein
MWPTNSGSSAACAGRTLRVEMSGRALESNRTSFLSSRVKGLDAWHCKAASRQAAVPPPTRFSRGLWSSLARTVAGTR